MPTPPPAALRLLRALLPLAERDEVVADLAAEHASRARRDGAAAARRWAWRQVLGSVAPLLRRGWWRGMTGFEPAANRSRPGGPSMESWIIDARYALRRLRTRPAYGLLAVLTLALGVGGATAMGAVARSILTDPLPYPNEARLGIFWNTFDWSEAELLHLRGHWSGFSSVAGYRQEGVTLQVDDAPARLVPGISASAELFRTLGRAPLLGTGFRAGDDRLGAEPVAVLSHGLWQELGADPAIVGSRLRLDGVERTVVGVMPPGFWFPDPTTRVWLAEELDPENGSGNYALVGRSETDVTPGALAPHLGSITRRLGERFDYPPQWDKTANAVVTPIREQLVGPLRPALLATLAAMGMILLIACANVSSLMLGQVDGRATELAVRSALGAERRRLLQQLVAEALVLGLAAGAAGALVAALTFRVLLGALPLGAWAEGAALDWTLLPAAIAVALVAALLVAIVPVLAMRRTDLRDALARSRTGGVGGRGGRLESGLVVAEVALAVLMTAGAALLVRSVANLHAIDPGVRTEGVAVLDVSLPADQARADRQAMLVRLRDELAAMPGVRSASITHKLPLRGGGSSSGVTVVGRSADEATTTFFRVVGLDYFATMGIPVTRGRVFERTDAVVTPPEGSDSTARPEVPVVINEALAARYFPGEDPVGRLLAGGMSANERIVGVVQNVAEGGLTDATEPARYWMLGLSPFLGDEQTFVVHAERGDGAALLEPARRLLQEAAPGVAVREATTMGLVFARAVGPAQQVMLLLALLTGLAVLLGAIGVYGVVSHYVARRRRDWAIRIALGLPPSRVVARIVRRGTLLVLGGVAIGVAAAAALARLASALLYGVGAADPASLAAAAVALLLVGVVAALVPAWRAGRTHPALVLREE